MVVSEILAHCSYRSWNGIDADVTSLTIDSRSVNKGTAFIARRGEKYDGHSFITSAISDGATLVVCEECDEHTFSFGVCSILIVEDSAIALAEIAHVFYHFPSRAMKVIGITGTNGKTTCTFILKQLLESAGNTVGLIGTTGNYIGNELRPATHTTPEAHQLCALLAEMRDAGCSYVVMEVSSHALALRRVYGMTFSGAMFTNLTPDHLDFHGTMEGYAHAKQILFRMLQPDAFAIVNADSPYSSLMLDGCHARQTLVGRNANAHVRISNEGATIRQTTFTMNEMDIRMPLLGSFNVENAALCIAAVVKCGVDANTVPLVMSHIYAAPGRMMTISVPNSAVAIIDYAHTPDALQKALETCRNMLYETNSKLYCVFGCGGNRDTSKRPLMGEIAEQLADYVILTNDNPRHEEPQLIIKHIISGIHDTDAVTVLPDRREAIYYALARLQEGDVLLIAGKGHEEYQIIGDTKTYFSDSVVVQEWIADQLRKQA